MGQQVIVTLSGFQFEEESAKPIEVIACGERYEKNGKIYVVYDEVAQNELVSNTIKIGKEEVDIIKRGSRGTHLFFCEGKSSITWYPTPFGELEVGIVTNHLSINHSNNKILIKIIYDLTINQSHISECMVDLCIEDKGRV